MRRWPAIAALALAPVATACSSGTGAVPGSRIEPLCHRPNESLILLAQTVQDATQIPCIAGYPAGWSYGGDDFRKGTGTFWLYSAIAGMNAVEVKLTPSCEPSGDPIDTSGVPGIEGSVSSGPKGETRTFVFDGGCAEQTITLPPASDDRLLREARITLGFLVRGEMATTLEQDYGVTLCGPGAPPCEG